MPTSLPRLERPSSLRARRLLRGLRLRDVERATDIPDTTISRLERGELPLVGRWLTALTSGDILHFRGTHSPATVGPDCRYAGAWLERETTIGTASCLLSRLFSFLHRLDELGVYDRSLVLVVSDHGHPFLPIDPDRARTPASEAERGSAPVGDLDAFWRGVPLFLVKRIGQRHRLRTSDAPVSLCDVPATIAEELGVPSPYECPSVFSSAATGVRERPRVYFSQPSYLAQRNARNKRVEFEKFLIEGHSWNAGSWRAAPPASRQ